MSDLDEYYAEQDERMNIIDEDFDDYVARRVADRIKCICTSPLFPTSLTTVIGPLVKLMIWTSPLGTIMNKVR
jgi:hypothetical protein